MGLCIRYWLSCTWTNLFLSVSFPYSLHLTWDVLVQYVSEAEHSKAWKTAYFSIKSFSKGIQGIFDALFLIVFFVKRQCHPAEMRDNLQACIVCVVYFACLCTKDELAAVNKSQTCQWGDYDVTNRLWVGFWTGSQLPGFPTQSWCQFIQQKMTNTTMINITAVSIHLKLYAAVWVDHGGGLIK